MLAGTPPRLPYNQCALRRMRAVAFPLPAVGDIVRITARCRLYDQIGLNVHHYRVSAVGATPLAWQVVADDVSGILSVVYKPVLANPATWDGVYLKVLFPTPALATVVSADSAGVGTAGAVPLPRQDTGVASRGGALSGRQNLGRSYVPFPAVADNGADSKPTAGYQTRLLALSAVVNNAIVSGAGAFATTLTPVLLNQNVPIGPAAVTDIVIWGAGTLWATQKSRGSYGRPNPV